MARAPRDTNREVALLGTSNVDNFTTIPILADPVTGRLLVNASVSVTSSGSAIQDGVSGTIVATVLDYANSNPLAVRLTDSNGDYATISTAGLATESTLSTLSGKIPSLGQALAAASLPVVLTAAQITTLTPPAAITGFSTSTKQSDGSQKTQLVDGSGNVIGSTTNALDVNIKSGSPTTVTANAGTNLNTSALALETGGNLATLAGTVTGAKVATRLSDGSGNTIGSTSNALDVNIKSDATILAVDVLGMQQTAITSSTAETTIATADATHKLRLYGLVLANTSATATNVTVKDSTGGTTRFVFALPAGDTRGFMIPAQSGHPQAASNTNWTATSSASVASLQVTAMFVRV
jgi:hypothetical protein